MTPPQRAPGDFPVVGIIGGGQLARMCAGPAAELAVALSVLAEAPDAAAAQVIPSAPVGQPSDLEAVCRFAAECDVVTFDHEHVPGDVLAALQAQGTVVRPGPEALIHAQDKLAMRQRLTAMGINCPRWRRADTRADVEEFGAEVGWPIVAKTPRGGYDGHGVRLIAEANELDDWLARAASEDTGLLLEEEVHHLRELSALIARSPSGQAAAWPVVETVQTDGICTEVIAPAPGIDPDFAARATEAALRIAAELDVTGVMAVEMFEIETGDPDRRSDYQVNELAMRPHNSGHWSMDGAITGQFEQHLRAVLDLPLGDPSPRSDWTVMTNILGGTDLSLYPAYRHVMARDPEIKVHLYGKGVRPGRKLGHVNLSGSDVGELRERAGHAAAYITGTIRE